MKEFRDRVAVVTGAASGIGRGMAERFAAEGMKVVLADIEEDALRQAEVEMREKGFDVLGVRTDVAQAGDVEKLAQQTLDAFGRCTSSVIMPAWWASPGRSGRAPSGTGSG